MVARHFTHVSIRLPNKMDYFLHKHVLKMVLYQKGVLKNVAYCLYLIGKEWSNQFEAQNMGFCRRNATPWLSNDTREKMHIVNLLHSFFTQNALFLEKWNAVKIIRTTIYFFCWKQVYRACWIRMTANHRCVCTIFWLAGAQIWPLEQNWLSAMNESGVQPYKIALWCHNYCVFWGCHDIDASVFGIKLKQNK